MMVFKYIKLLTLFSQMDFFGGSWKSAKVTNCGHVTMGCYNQLLIWNGFQVPQMQPCDCLGVAQYLTMAGNALWATKHSFPGCRNSKGLLSDWTQERNWVINWELYVFSFKVFTFASENSRQLVIHVVSNI